MLVVLGGNRGVAFRRMIFPLNGTSLQKRVHSEFVVLYCFFFEGGLSEELLTAVLGHLVSCQADRLQSQLKKMEEDSTLA